MSDFKYFVWRFNEAEPYRAYGLRSYYGERVSDARCIWHGDDLAQAQRVAVAANQINRSVDAAEQKRKDDALKAEMQKEREKTLTPLFRITTIEAGKP